MRRPRPIRRLVDGSAGASGSAVARRTTVLLVPVTLVSNGIGALIVLVLVAFVLPKPEVADRGEVLLVNLAVVAGYLVLAFLRRLRGAPAWRGDPPRHARFRLVA